MVPLYPSSFSVPSNLCSLIPSSLLSLRFLPLQLYSSSWKHFLETLLHLFFPFSSAIYISSLVILTLADGFCGLSFWCTNRYWKIFANTKANWQVSFLSPLLSLTYLYHLSNSLHKLLNIICAQSTFCPFFALNNLITLLL